MNNAILNQIFMQELRKQETGKKKKKRKAKKKLKEVLLS